jgi:L,D-peptidoglycan transpeptidase YkuD (ErfK/YbiS/YcfS/YnhG family)
VDAARVPDRDWSSSEKVNPASPAFRWCVMVAHNWQPYPGFGSCIYLHGWRAPGLPTSGCTAMAPANVERVVRWLDAAKHPLLVQLPEEEYRRLKTAWALP